MLTYADYAIEVHHIFASALINMGYEVDVYTVGQHPRSQPRFGFYLSEHIEQMKLDPPTSNAHYYLSAMKKIYLGTIAEFVL
jgi:hypothetical protein